LGDCPKGIMFGHSRFMPGQAGAAIVSDRFGLVG
jgi:hypothetical protein